MAITGYLEPLSALVFSAAILQERLTIIQVVGAIIILGGAALGEFLRPSLQGSREWSPQPGVHGPADWPRAGAPCKHNQEANRSVLQPLAISKWVMRGETRGVML